MLSGRFLVFELTKKLFNSENLQLLMDKEGLLAVFTVVVFLALLSMMSWYDATITGAHHLSGRSVNPFTRFPRGQTWTVSCDEFGASLLGKYIRNTYGCDVISGEESCRLSVKHGGQLRWGNRVEFQEPCPDYKKRNEFVANCIRRYVEECEKNK